MDNKIDFYVEMRKWLIEQLEWYTVQMYQNKDKDGHNMHSVYFGHVMMIESTLRQLSYLKAQDLKEEN